MADRVERVLQVHTRYRQAGGEDRLVEAERALLEEAGIAVRQVIFDNADLQESASLLGDARLAASAIWSRGAAERVRAAIAGSGAQVVHVHNTFPAASPSVYSAAARAGVPVVQTVHNYRFVCPAATAYRSGRVCTDCVRLPVALPAVAHACVRGSRAQSAVATAILAVHRSLGTYRQRIAVYLALTDFQRRMLEQGGLPAQRMRVVPNFLEPDPGEGSTKRSGILFVGRLSPEKGVQTLLDAAAEMPGVVRIAGDGPLRPAVESAAAAGIVRYLGPLRPAQVLAALRETNALVLPSTWFEGFPLVILESFASGTPVIASRIGSLAEIVEDGRTGMLVDVGDSGELAAMLRTALTDAPLMRQLGQNARSRYERSYRGSTHLAALEAAYAEAMDLTRSTEPLGAPPGDPE